MDVLTTGQEDPVGAELDRLQGTAPLQAILDEALDRNEHAGHEVRVRRLALGSGAVGDEAAVLVDQEHLLHDVVGDAIPGDGQVRHDDAGAIGTGACTFCSRLKVSAAGP